MKSIFRNIIIAASFLTAFIISGCVKEDFHNDGQDNEEMTLRITASLPEGEPETKLTYFESGKSIKALWSSDDCLAANGDPGTTDYLYIFNLVEGDNTPTGVFECKASSTGWLPYYLSTNVWTIYFPGSEIRCEADYLNFSYSGQIQKGNGNLDHLKKFHTIRLQCTDGSEGSSTIFEDAFIDFSGEGYEESACMKFHLTGLPSITPTEVSLQYTAPAGNSSSCFYTHNYLTKWWSGGGTPNSETTNKLSIRLDGFSPSTEADVYMMMSNYPVNLKAGGKLTISVKSKEGKLYTCSKTLKADATLAGGRLHNISGSSWTESVAENIDGFDNPEDGIVVLQEASKGNGTDIIIMGDGFSKTHFGNGGNYDKVMRQAYEDFFSIEPYSSLKEYFNVYYINAVSEDDHDATPLMNGAIQGTANTVFSTTFTENSTSITGDNNVALSYAMQAIRQKGGKGGTECSDEDEINRRANSSLMIVMVNVACHAGTCSMSYSSGTDYCAESSVAYSALSFNAEGCRLTLIHEAGGHGFGKLADEYGGYRINGFSTADWNNLINLHSYGLQRNVNEHWTAEEKDDGWNVDFRDTYTDESNVYWSELLYQSYGYTASEGLGIYRGARTYDNLYCRPTDNSMMRDQFAENGNFFNAISRWAIWYRLMRLTGSISSTDFKSSLNEFIAFDRTLDIDMNSAMTRSSGTEGLLPLAPPVLVEVE